nr:ribonuclease H-like domain-containing protein [Tanacetum cinerariifolium]
MREYKEQDTSSSSGNDAHDDGADIKPIYDEEPMAKVEIAVLGYDGDECDKGRMPTKIELTPEQSQQVKMEILLEPTSNKLLVELKKLSVNIWMMARIRLANIDSDEGPSYDSAFISDVIQVILWIVDSGSSKLMTGDLKLLKNFVEKFIGRCKEFYDSDLEVVFQSKTCYVYNLEGDDLLTGRKAYLLEDKQIPSIWDFDEVFLALGWNFEEIHVTWAHLEKKRTRLRTYAKSLEDLCKVVGDGVVGIKRHHYDLSSDGVKNLATASKHTNGIIKVLPPKTAEEVVARERERKTRTTLLMALPEDHLAKFHKMADAKEMWEAIKSRFCGNDESKKMQKYLLKQQFEGFSISTSEGLHKGYDRFQTLLIQLEINGLDTLSFDDLYNNLRVFEHDVKGTTASSLSTHNVAFMFAENTSSTNDVSTAYNVSSPSVSKSQKEGSSSYTDEVIHSFFKNQLSAPQPDYDDLEHIHDDDMEEMDLKWKVDMISMRIKKFHKRTGRKLQFDTKDPVDSKRRDVGYNGNKTRDNGRKPAYQDDSKSLVTFDREDINWSGYVEEDAQNYAMMAYSSSNSGSDNEACDLEYTPINDRFADGMHVVPLPMTGNYMPSGPDVEIDYSKFTYGPKQTLADESDSKLSKYASCESDSSVETSITMPESVENASKVICEPKVWTDAPIIEEENIKETGITNHSPIIEKQDRSGHTRKGLGYDFTKKACFVCARQNYSSQAASASTASKVNTVRPFVNETRPKRNFYKTHSPNKRPFHNTIAQRTTFSYQKINTVGNKSLSVVKGNRDTVVKASADDLHRALKDKGIVDSGCFRHMTGNRAHLADYQEFKGGSVSFGGSNGRITGKGKIKTGILNFEDVYYMEELKHYNLFSVSQMCDKKNKVLFTDTNYLVLSPDFKLPDENQVLIKIPRQHNMYSFNLKNIDPSEDLACLFAKASIDESNKWHRRLRHVNFKNLNKLMKGNLVRGLPFKIFKNNHTYVACQKGKQHKASCKFDGKSDSGFLVRYSLNSKAFRVYNLETKRVEENLHKIKLTNLQVQNKLTIVQVHKTLFIKKDKKDIMLVQVYVNDIIFGSTKKSWCDEFKELMKNRFYVTQKTSHLQAVKSIFRYLKGQPKFGLWCPKVLSFDLEAYSDSDYAGVNLDRKSTTGGCQFLGRRLILWQCKKHTIVATSTTEAEYVAAAHFCRQVLWIQNQLLDYRDAYEKKLIQVLKIHTDDNVADLLIKAFDVSSKELASPKQTALGKNILNPLMAGRLPKNTLPTSHGMYKDVDPHEFTHV